LLKSALVVILLFGFGYLLLDLEASGYLRFYMIVDVAVGLADGLLGMGLTLYQVEGLG